MKTLALLALAVEGAALVMLVHRALVAQDRIDRECTPDHRLAELATLGRASVPTQPPIMERELN